jgi:hypothetical protein
MSVNMNVRVSTRGAAGSAARVGAAPACLHDARDVHGRAQAFERRPRRRQLERGGILIAGGPVHDGQRHPSPRGLVRGVHLLPPTAAGAKGPHRSGFVSRRELDLAAHALRGRFHRGRLIRGGDGVELVSRGARAVEIARGQADFHLRGQ